MRVFPREQLRLDPSPDAEPAGIIFHVARCGSTLIANTLKQLASLADYSEPPAINDILFPPQRWARSEIIAALRVVVGFLRRHAGRPVVLKFRSWNTLFSSLILEAFLSTPWAFVVRDPVEVGVSVLRKPPTWLRAFSESDNPFLRFVKGPVSSAEEYTAKMFGAFCDAIAHANPARGIVLDYRDLPAAICDTLPPHFGILPTRWEQQRIVTAARTYSNSSLRHRQIFIRDSLTKQRTASVVRQADCILSNFLRARFTFSRISEAVAVQRMGLGF